MRLGQGGLRVRDAEQGDKGGVGGVGVEGGRGGGGKVHAHMRAEVEVDKIVFVAAFEPELRGGGRGDGGSLMENRIYINGDGEGEWEWGELNLLGNEEILNSDLTYL